MPKKAAKGARGNGSIRQRPDGRWEARFTIGRDPGTGKQIQRSVYGATQKEVAQKLRQVTAELDEGTYHEPCRMTVGEWLDIWCSEYINNVKETTALLYQSTVKYRIKPAIGAVKLSALKTDEIQHFYNELMRGEKPLSAKTVKNIHGILHRALSQAVRVGYLRTNPADNVTLARTVQKELKPLTDDAITQFLTAIKGHEYEMLFTVDLFTGMRRGEILGLTWDCVDFDAGTITISKQLIMPKDGLKQYKLLPTKNGKTRTITPAQYVMDILGRRQGEQEREREAAGEQWSNPEGFVFTDKYGCHLFNSSVYQQFKRIMKSIGMPEVRFHDLRHSYAIASLQSGDDIKTLQENLGHHTAAFTLNVYGHVSEQMKRDSAARMDAFIRSVSEPSKSSKSIPTEVKA